MARKILGVNIDELIKNAILETFPANEKSAQDKKSKELKQFKASEKKEVDEAEGEEVKQVKAADIVELFNVMRSGKSLKDAEVRKQFQMYFDSLSGSERVSLFAFSKAMADIISGENSLEDVRNQPQPEDFGVEVTKDDDAPKQKKVKKKKVAKAEKKDDSTPIVVGESANKSRELRILRGNK